MINKIDISENLRKLINGAKDLNAKIYPVGGFVRNSLIGFPSTEIDLAGTLPLHKLEVLCKVLGFGFKVINKKLGTCLITAGAEEFEYTRFRKESYSDSGGEHSPEEVEFIDVIETDASRRDFTVNALYYDYENSKILDFYNGINDLKNKKLKCIKTPNEVFSDDGLRVLRFIRFSCELNFVFDKSSLKEAKKRVYLLKDISKERVLKELKLILTSDTKYEVNTFQHIKALQVFNEFKIWQYLFNSSFKNIKIKTSGSLFNMFKFSKPENRHYVFIMLVLLNYFNHKKVNSENLKQAVFNLLGVQGLKESNKTINNVIALYDLFQQLYFEKEINVLDCVKFESLDESFKSDFENINKVKIHKIILKIKQLKENNFPFSVDELNISNKQLMNSGVANKNINEIKKTLFNMCFQGVILNEEPALLSEAQKINNILNNKLANK